MTIRVFHLGMRFDPNISGFGILALKRFDAKGISSNINFNKSLSIEKIKRNKKDFGKMKLSALLLSI